MVFAVRREWLVRCHVVLRKCNPVEDDTASLRILGGGEEVQVTFADGEVVAHLEGCVRVDVRSTVYNDGTSVNV